MSMLVAREMARHRLRRVHFIGVSRTALRQRQQELSEHQQRQRAPMRLHGLAGFAALQQFGGGAGRGGVGGG